MLSHSADPTIFEVDDDEFVAACDCGWQTEVHDTVEEAIFEFEQVHFLAGAELIDHDDIHNDREVHDIFNGCNFCGHEDHTAPVCPRKPVYKV